LHQDKEMSALDQLKDRANKRKENLRTQKEGKKKEIKLQRV
jgi:hypothetical protein